MTFSPSTSMYLEHKLPGSFPNDRASPAPLSVRTRRFCRETPRWLHTSGGLASHRWSRTNRVSSAVSQLHRDVQTAAQTVQTRLMKPPQEKKKRKNVGVFTKREETNQGNKLLKVTHQMKGSDGPVHEWALVRSKSIGARRSEKAFHAASPDTGVGRPPLRRFNRTETVHPDKKAGFCVPAQIWWRSGSEGLRLTCSSPSLAEDRIDSNFRIQIWKKKKTFRAKKRRSLTESGLFVC